MKKFGARVKGTSILLLTAALWGFAFPAQIAASEHITALSYTGVRFALGALPLIPVIALLEKNKDKDKLRVTIIWGSFCGLLMFLAIIAQQFSMNYIDSSGEVSFLTAMYMLIVPVIETIMGNIPKPRVWIGVFLGCVGMLCLTLKNSFTVEPASILLLGGALLWAIHIIVVGKFSDKIYPITFAFSQFSVTAILGIFGMFLFESPSMDSMVASWPYILYGGLVSVGIAFTCQIIGQRYAAPETAAIILSTESIFGAVGGVIMGEPMLSLREIIGCVLIFGGILLSQITAKKERGKTND